MKKYENPEMELERLEVADIITASSGVCGEDCDGYVPCMREF